jgi:tetratricopeptide (TPR) repeat protein
MVVVPLAERAALTAVRLDGEDPWAHLSLGGVHLIRRRFDDAIAAIELALNLNPSFSHAQNLYATTLVFSGRCREAIDAVNRALRLSPHDPFVAFNYGNVALAHYLSGNYAEAVRQSQAAVRLRPGYGSAYRLLAASAGMAGQTEIAAAALQDLRRVQPNASLEWIKTYVPLKNDADLIHYLEGFRRAGLE